MTNNYPFFLNAANRDKYLDKLVINGFQVKAITVDNAAVEFNQVVDRYELPRHVRLFLATKKYYGVLYTIEEIDKRKGK